MKEGKVTFAFDTPRANEEITQAVLTVGHNDNGGPCVTPRQLEQLLLKAAATLIIIATGNQKDALRAACQHSALLQQCMDAAVAGEYRIQIHIEMEPHDLN